MVSVLAPEGSRVQRDDRWRAVDSELTRLAEAATPTVRRLFRAEARVIDEVLAAGGAASLDFALEAVSVPEWEKVLETLWIANGERVFSETWRELEPLKARAPRLPDFPEAIREIRTFVGERARQIVENTQRRIRETAQRAARSSAENLDQLVRNEVRSLYETWNGGRSAAIARHNVLAATAQAQNVAARASGATLVKEWVSMKDARVRRAHREADGQTVGMEGEYLVGGESLRYPRDPAGSAANTANCRCIEIYKPAPESFAEAAIRVDPLPDVPTWESVGGKTPRIAERKKLVNDALDRINKLPEPLRSEYLDALGKFDKITFAVATKSTKSMSTYGKVTQRWRSLDRARTERTLYVQLSRMSDDWVPWVKRHNATVSALRREPPGPGRDHIQGILDDLRANEPEQWRLATVDETESVLIHELTHAIDFERGQIGGAQAISALAQLDGGKFMDLVWSAKWGGSEIIPGTNRIRPLPGAVGNDGFAYAVSSPQEAVAEVTRMYHVGMREKYGDQTEAVTMSAEEWRAKYPELAQWVEDHVING